MHSEFNSRISSSMNFGNLLLAWYETVKPMGIFVEKLIKSFGLERILVIPLQNQVLIMVNRQDKTFDNLFFIICLDKVTDGT